VRGNSKKKCLLHDKSGKIFAPNVAETDEWERKKKSLYKYTWVDRKYTLNYCCAKNRAKKNL
jgi:hypothetical protein